MSKEPNILTMITALLGVVIGTAGFVISLLNYFRDRPKVIVTLNWNSVAFDANGEQIKWSGISVTNIGRRPIFVSHAHLHYPDTTRVSLITESFDGAKLLEGDPPKTYLLDDTANLRRLEKCAAEWWRVRARIADHTGTNWWSARVTEKPGWGTGPSPTYWQWVRYRFLTEVPVVRSVHRRSVRQKQDTL